jgi:hypothetical protein
MRSILADYGLCYFLLQVQRRGKPITYNYYLTPFFGRNAADEFANRLKRTRLCFRAIFSKFLTIYDIDQFAANKSNWGQVCEDILNTVMSYYKVSRKRFVASICQQVIRHFLWIATTLP